MTRDARSSWAAFALALGMFLYSLPRPEPPLPDCPAPRAARDPARGVRCDGAGAPLRGPARLLYGLRLDPNLASAASLEALPGIGPVRAAAIVAERARGRFETVAALRRVRGIGPVTLDGITPWLEVAAAGTEEMPPAVREVGPGARLQQNR